MASSSSSSLSSSIRLLLLPPTMTPLYLPSSPRSSKTLNPTPLTAAHNPPRPSSPLPGAPPSRTPSSGSAAATPPSPSASSTPSPAPNLRPTSASSSLEGLTSQDAGGMLGINPDQLNLIQDLAPEDSKLRRMSATMAQLQQEGIIMVRTPLLPIVRQGDGPEVSAVMEPYEEKLAKLLEETDKLRIRTLAEGDGDGDTDTEAGSRDAGGG